jgi:hypothetical protein
MEKRACILKIVCPKALPRLEKYSKIALAVALIAMKREVAVVQIG